jgi:hypothetical protein
MKKEKKKVSSKRENPGPLFIPAGVLMGMGFGFLFNNLPAGLFIGIGFGFLLFAFVEIFFIMKEK